MVSELPNSSMASNVAVDSKTQPTDPLPSTNHSMTVDCKSNSTSSMDVSKFQSVVLVSQPLTGLENYLSWSRAVFLSLSGRKKFGFVNGQTSMPDPSSSLYNAWHRSNIGTDQIPPFFLGC